MIVPYFLGSVVVASVTSISVVMIITLRTCARGKIISRVVFVVVVVVSTKIAIYISKCRHPRDS